MYVKGKLKYSIEENKYEIEIENILGYFGKEEDDIQFIYDSYGLVGLNFY
jgi:hypothetical protein